MKHKKTLLGKILALSGTIVLSLHSCEKFDEYDISSYTDPPVTALINEDKAERIAGLVINTLNSKELIGIQVSIRDSMGESWNMSFGSKDLQQTKRLTNQDILRIGSVSKIYTSALILKLVEHGALEPGQSLTDFFPDYEEMKNVTILNLLNHSSGIADIFSIPAVFISCSNFPGKQWNPEQMAKDCLDKGLDFKPGTKHSYSNTNFILLGLIAEQVTGRRIHEVFSEILLEPRNLTSTRLVPYMDPPKELVNGYVHHFALNLKEWYTTEPENSSWATAGYTAGALVSNSTSLSLFTHRLFSGSILESESLAAMTTFSDKYGLGLMRMNINNNTYWGHEGEITGFESITAYNPERGITISICCNTTPFKIHDLLKQIDTEL